MDWSKMLGQALGGLGVGMMLDKWLDVEDPTTLRYTIRNDIRDFNSGSVEIMLTHLRDQIKYHTIAQKRTAVDRLLVVKEMFLEEAERLNL